MVATNAACKLFILHVFLACAVLFQSTKPGNVELIKILWVSLFLRENLKYKNFIAQKFPDLRYVYGMSMYTSASNCVDRLNTEGGRDSASRLMHGDLSVGLSLRYLK